VVDVDGGLLKADPLWDGVLDLVLRSPRTLPGALRALVVGRAALAGYVGEHATWHGDTAPLQPAAERVVAAALGEGQPVVLLSTHYPALARALGQRLGAHAVLADPDSLGAASDKLELLRSRYGSFDFVGSERADPAVWNAARRAVSPRAPGWTPRDRAAVYRPDSPEAAGAPRPRPAWLRALRPTQWSKNVLIAFPALAAHATPTLSLVVTLLFGFLAFSCTASAVYLLNDLADLPHDRAHPRKRHRPIAAGDVSVPGAFGMALALLGAAAVFAARLPGAFQAVLLGYFVLTTAYSYTLKRRLLIDVICLATLYTCRVLAGGLLVGIMLTDWFLAFFIFVFLSLALIKRVDELRRTPLGSGAALAGRAYEAGDLPVLTAFGVGCGVASAVVYCLFIASADSERLYTHPVFLWLALPLVLYWQARMWLLTVRGGIQDDPVRFTARDRITYLAVGVMALLLMLSA
jgi:4-hydroxybenzoate polyprenyltransferase